ncbi:hypothetical protein B0H15DRAFT_51601 [Mycena belliarum]|uniref:Uncharacterized protein n=1 Tax=Mycena belliarum TaxID=1033014 RepID=A0AAD6XSL4_9AGAR|nr:hypothetical protein B0H15DRAFT_51601 [Mycena belliae]
MQAVYSTTTDVKIHKAIRREWASFEAWLYDQRRRLEYRQNEILAAAQRKRGKMKQADITQQIRALQEEFMDVARGEWLARVRQSQLHLEHWVMTPDEKLMLQQALAWTQRDMVDAYVKEQEEMGAMYQRVDPGTLGTQEAPDPQSPSRFMHPRVTENTPAYARWATELAKINGAASSSHRPPTSPYKPAKSPRSVELPALPLYFVGALLQGTDVDAVTEAEVEHFALRASEDKIREYYAEACDATLHFQRLLPTLEPAQREEAQEGFERHMRDLASGKEREWKAMTVAELRKQQASELERRAAQQRVMRPSPPRRRRERPRQAYSEWDYVDDYDTLQPPQDYHADMHRSPQYRSPQYRNPQDDYFQEYQSPRREYRETYQSPLLDSSVGTYQSPRHVRRQPMPNEGFAVSPPVDGYSRLRRRNAVHRAEEYELSPQYGYDLPASIPYDELPPHPQQPNIGRKGSALTRWISNLGALLPRRKYQSEMRTISSFDWMPAEPENHAPEKNSKSAKAKPSKKDRRPPEYQSYQEPGWGESGEYAGEYPEVYSDEEFPMRKKSRWREKLFFGRKRKNRSPTASDIGWADPDSD